MNIKELQTAVQVLHDAKEKPNLPLPDKIQLDTVYNLFHNISIDATKAKAKGNHSPIKFVFRVDLV